jgi:hypothetical protein
VVFLELNSNVYVFKTTLLRSLRHEKEITHRRTEGGNRVAEENDHYQLIVISKTAKNSVVVVCKTRT